jgi:hypothetical protein
MRVTLIDEDPKPEPSLRFDSSLSGTGKGALFFDLVAVTV